MAYFMTKVWGFGEPVGPMLFGSAGWRDNAVAKLSRDDLVVLVGTQAEPTPEEERGRLLGIMQPTAEAVMSLDFPLEPEAVDYDEDGNYRWPYGLLNSRAWLLLDRPLLSEISDRHFAMNSAKGIVALTEGEAAMVSALAKREVELLKPSASAVNRIHQAGGHTGDSAPPPSTTRAGVMHMRQANAQTYLLELVGAKQASFKVGWAFDYNLRMRSFNHASMPSLGGIEYQGLLFHRWHTAREAFRMEQTLLRKFQRYQHRENREILVGVVKSELEAAWYDLIRSGS